MLVFEAFCDFKRDVFLIASQMCLIASAKSSPESLILRQDPSLVSSGPSIERSDLGSLSTG